MLGFDLLRLGHCPSVVASAHSALVHLQTDPATDLIVTDVLMPEMDGIELIRAIRRVHRTVPIVAMTCGGGMSKDLLLKSAQMLGADRVLSKPVNAKALGTAIAELVPLSSPAGAGATRRPTLAA
jgi:CheY-like chemotaxis protein